MVKKLILSLGALFISIVFIFCTSFSWFIDDNTKKTTIDGSTPTAYYKSGDGSKDNPYIIAKPIHLYNFAWLQYMGTYNKTDSDGNLIQTYFKIESEDTDESGNAVLDMSNTKYSVLPPIGTEKNPFVGNFDGNNTIVKGLTTSSNSSDFKTMPATVNSTDYNTTNQVHLLGFFGYIGEPSTDYTGYETSINTVSNLYIDNYTVKNTNTSNVLVGLLAGYANAQINNSGVISAQFDLISGTTSYSNYEKISKYTLVGDYNEENFNWSGKPDSGSGQGNDWGGSIDIASFAKRINYIAKSENSGNTPSAYATYTSTKFNAKLYYSKSFNWDTTYQSGQYVALMEGTYMPLNINLETATISGNYTGDMGSYYTSGSNTGEPVLSTNTGYIVGKNTSTGNATPRFHNKTFNSSKNGIPFSINVTDQDGTISSTDSDNDGIYDIFTYDNISFFYVDTSTSTTYRILDDENKNKTWGNKIGSTSSSSTQTTVNTINVSDCNFGDLKSGYYNVKHQFAQMLSDGNTATILDTKAININGIQIYGGSSNKDIVKSTYSNVRIHKQTIDSYEMLQGGFNFELEKSGSIKLVIGPYTSSGDSHIFPSLYKVERSSDLKTISSYKKITSIYSLNGKYYSQYSDNSATIPDGATKTFDLTSLYTQNTLKQNGAYYIEIPLDSGDYWFGPDSSENKCPYILYFDIGANAGDSGDTPDEDKSPIDFVYFNSSSKLVPIQNQNNDGSYTNNSDYVYSDAYFEVSGTSTSALKIQFKRTLESGTTETITLYYYFTADASVTLTPNKSDVATNSSSELIGGN